MASQKRARTSSGQARSAGTAARPGSGNASSRNGGNRTASSAAVRSGEQGRAGAGRGGAAQGRAGQGAAGQGGGRGQASRGQGGRAQGGRAEGGGKGSRADGRPGQGQPNGATARVGILTAEPSAGAANARYAPRWLQLTALVLSLAGLGVSIYLTIAHYTSSKILVCSDNGLVNCGKVTTSSESIVFGVFPVAVLGLAFYVFMVAINTPWAWRARLPIIWWARLGSIVVGIGFVLYLLYAEIIEIGNICLWCTSVHVITFLLFVLLIFAASIGSTTTITKPAR
jgi:uncharacterized membrane protein